MPEFVTLEEAVIYFETSRPYKELWDAADDSRRLLFLNWSSDVLLMSFRFRDDVLQAERDPGRSTGRLKKAVCELTLHLMQRDPTKELALLTKGLSRASAGPLSATFDKRFVATLVPDHVKQLVGDLGEFIGGSGMATLPFGNVTH